jgi:hypothetical protein
MEKRDLNTTSKWNSPELSLQIQLCILVSEELDILVVRNQPLFSPQQWPEWKLGLSKFSSSKLEDRGGEKKKKKTHREREIHKLSIKVGCWLSSKR